MIDSFKSIARSLRHRNYRLFFFGQGISLVGTWLTRVATSWLVYRLSHSALVLGWVSFAGQLPTFLIAPAAGVLVDRWNKHRILVITQICAALQSAALAYLTISGQITITQILILSAFQGLINAFDMPVRQAFVVEMIEDRKDLPNAIALNSSLVNLARLIGPSVAGILIATVGEGGCFAIDAISYGAVIFTLLLMTVRPQLPSAAKPKRLIHDLKEGIRYARNSPSIKSILSLLSLISLMGMPYMVLLPMIVSERLNGDAHLLGFLTAASGLGALIGALFLASRKSVLGLGKIIPGAAILFGLSIACFGTSRVVWLSLPLMFFSGMGMMVNMASCNTLLQTIADEDKRGRLMSLYTMSFVGMAPFGSLLGGVAAHWIGTAATLQAGGLLCAVGGLLFLRHLGVLRKELRPIYQKLGIIKSPAVAVERASSMPLPTEH